MASLAPHLRRSLLAYTRKVVIVPGVRSFWNVSLPVLGGPGGAHTTKYNIVKDGRDGVEWDDFLLALPEREHLATYSKEVPLFLRYLKVVTDKEDRSNAFTAFLERAKAGLVVESSVFITTEELLAVMWKNGFSESERNAVQFTFPADYKFHYPELAVLFDITEEDTYKFCMRSRIESSHIGALDHDQVKRKGFIRDHWLTFGVGLIIFKYFPFFNYYWGVKVFGTSMWCYTMWTGLNRFIAKTCRRNEYMAAQKTAQDVMEGEDAIVASMRRFANDAKCVEYLGTFKEDTETKIATYRQAIAAQMKADMTERALKQLQAIAAFEASMGSAMQELVVREAAASFKDAFPSNSGMQDRAFAAAVKSLSGQQLSVDEDPVAAHFNSAFASLQGVDLSTTKGDAKGSLAERVAFAQQAKDLEFQQSFMVTSSEAAEVKSFAGAAKVGDGYDVSKLAPDAAERLDALYTSINAKVGFAMPDLAMKPIPHSKDSDANAYIDKVNAQLAASAAQLKAARLQAFVSAF